MSSERIKRIHGGRVIDPAVNLDASLDILIENGRIKSLINTNTDFPGVTEKIDVSGKILTPGLIDMHTHLREPGQEYKEGIENGTKAAASGGITSVACMANTDPVNDNGSVTDFIIRRAAEFGYARVYPIGAVSKSLAGVELSEMGELAAAGCVAFSDDGNTIMNAELMRCALEYARDLDKCIIVHAEDLNLLRGGVMHEGSVGTQMGLPGAPSSSEEVIVARDIILSRMTGAPVHFAHISTAGSVELIRKAKEDGVPVTAETCPHYFTMTHQAVLGYNTRARVNPPLREDSDVEAIKNGLKEGVLDCIASDHAPHARHEKEVEFERAMPGISGIETILGLTLTLVDDGTLSLIEAIEKLTVVPARIIGIESGTLSRGAPADITVIDMEKEWTVKTENFISKGKFTPFEGMKLKGRAVATFINGEEINIERE